MRYVLSQWKVGGRQNYKDLYFVMLLIGFLLLLRDAFGVAVNKYIFLAVVAVATFAFPIDKVMYLIAFIMPLYVGVPGNYMTLVFLVRFLGEVKRVRINSRNLIFCVLAGGYALVQAVLTGYTEIPQLIFFPSMLLVMFLFSLNMVYDKNKLVLFYCLGTAAMGMIMLISTLQVHDFMDLLSSATRLGKSTTRFADVNEMNVSMDPNFYGMFAIAAISTGAEVLSRAKGILSKGERSFLIGAIACCLIVVLIGLSRAFFLMAIIWSLLYAISRKKAKTFFYFLVAAALGVLIIYWLMPDVIEAIFERWSGDDVIDGNGRLTLINGFAAMWQKTVTRILFGVGIFRCNVHCTPLQVLFGGGVVFTVLFAGFVTTLGPKMRKTQSIPYLQRWLPMLVTVAMSMTVPALMLLNTMYPLVLVGLYNKEESN